LFANECKPWDQENPKRRLNNLNDVTTYDNVYRYGRPLTGSTFYTQHIKKKNEFKNIALNNTIILYKSKLTAGRKNIRIQDYKDEDVLAIMGARLGVIKPLIPSISMKLVGSHMAILNGMNSYRSMLSIEYYSEPALAEAARLHMNRFRLYILQQFHRLVSSRQVSTGERGEDILGFLLLIAMDDARNTVLKSRKQHDPEQCLEAVSVRLFLQHLYKDTEFEKVKTILIKEFGQTIADDFLDNYEMCFNQCVRFSEPLDKINFDGAIKRLALIRCIENQPVLDFVAIAVRKVDDSTST
jgi:hypothetical protein